MANDTVDTNPVAESFIEEKPEGFNKSKMTVQLDLDLNCSRKRSQHPEDINDCSVDVPSYLQGRLVAVGYFGRPKELSESHSKFPCLQAHLVGSNDKPIGDSVEFVLDTLSESVTLTKENFERCSKKFVSRRTITCSNNMSFEDDVYSGKIFVGDHLFEIEMCCDTVNSLPSKLFAVFDHVVTRGKHYWIWPDSQ